jgi:hypothetical protein
MAMGIYSVRINGRLRYVRATERDGQFLAGDAYAGSLGELVAKGARTYATQFEAGAVEYRLVKPGQVVEQLERGAAVDLAEERLAGQPTGADAIIQRRERGGEWMSWRRYAVHPDGGIVRVDR